MDKNSSLSECYNQLNTQFAFAIAQGEALEIIQQAQSMCEQAQVNLDQFLKPFNLKTKREDSALLYVPFDESKPVESTSWTRANKDHEEVRFLPTSMKIISALLDLKKQMDLDHNFNQICYTLMYDDADKIRTLQEKSPEIYTLERIQDHYIITFPLTRAELAIYPTDAEPISFADYVALKEEAKGTNYARPTKRFFEKTLKP